MFANLLSNSVKFSQPKDVARIEIGSRASEDGQEWLYYVRDYGVGFDMADARQLFGVFQCLPGAEQFAGSGVGLAIVQRIVEQHGGQVWAESAPDEGATFFFSLPVIPK